MANLFDNLSSKVFTRSNQLVEDGLNKLIPGDNILAKGARAFLGNQAERLLANGLFPGGENSQVQGLQNVRFTAENDIRARLSLSPQSGSLFYRDPSNRLMSPLSETDGVVWPYTPSVNVSYNAAYSGQNPSHTNYTQQSYAHSTVDQIQVVGQFTANNQDEARYLLATLWFLKVLQKVSLEQTTTGEHLRLCYALVHTVHICLKVYLLLLLIPHKILNRVLIISTLLLLQAAQED